MSNIMSRRIDYYTIRQYIIDYFKTNRGIEITPGAGIEYLQEKLFKGESYPYFHRSDGFGVAAF